MITTRAATRGDEPNLVDIYIAAIQNNDRETNTKDSNNCTLDTKPWDLNATEGQPPDSLSLDIDLPVWIDKDETEVIVAEKSGNVLGWGVIFISETPLAKIFVDPEAPRVETRNRLLSHCEIIAAEAKITHMSVLTY